jgi:hypothetical protein
MKIAPGQKIALETPAALSEEIAGLLGQLAHANLRPGPAGGAAIAAVKIEAPGDLMRQRYERDSAKLRDEVLRSEKKLAAANFTDKAPAEVVARERDKLEQYRRELAQVEEALAELAKSGR